MAQIRFQRLACVLSWGLRRAEPEDVTPHADEVMNCITQILSSSGAGIARTFLREGGRLSKFGM